MQNEFTGSLLGSGQAENIQETYHTAEPEMKREYLDLFFSKFMVKDGKIVAAMPSDYIKPLIKSGKLTVRIKNGWLPVHELIRNLHHFIASPDVIGAKSAHFSTL